ncbi:transposase [Streptosporangium album]|uniref:Transposase n=1 Tax=Streptosporangium album TaxID=47479 RepID=A0A7W7RQL7_9ACTN|nr:hypothetical protein [Streptosporangium album]MBB4935756.1 transposase [Streptosporangium album]
MNGGRIADAQFSAAAPVYDRLLGRLRANGVEGTGSYGAGLVRHLRAEGLVVIEVNRPDRW